MSWALCWQFSRSPGNMPNFHLNLHISLLQSHTLWRFTHSYILWHKGRNEIFLSLSLNLSFNSQISDVLARSIRSLSLICWDLFSASLIFKELKKKTLSHCFSYEIYSQVISTSETELYKWITEWFYMRLHPIITLWNSSHLCM